MHYFVFSIYLATYATMFMRCKLRYIPIGNVAARAVFHAIHNLPETCLTPLSFRLSFFRQATFFICFSCARILDTS